MKILVSTNHRYIDEIQSMAQIFFPHARFANISAEPGCSPLRVAKHYKPEQPEERPGCVITSYFKDEKVYAELFVDGKFIGNRFLNLTGQPVYVNDKRLAMLVAYHLLQETVGAYAPWGALTGVRPTKMVREWMAAGKTDDEIIRTLQETYCVHEDRARLAVTVAHEENRVAVKINSLTNSRRDDRPRSPALHERITSEINNRPIYNTSPIHQDDIPIVSHQPTHGWQNAAPTNHPPIAIYISIPFCPSRCIYCSFNTEHKPWSSADQARYIEAVALDCGQISDRIRENGMQISSIYIGGGTPTALSDDLLEILLGAVNEIAAGTESFEYTVEAGRPDTVTRSNLQLMRKYGVNRISINPQTFNDRTLEIIGRNHTTQDFCKAFEMVREEGFTCINTDIIAGLPGEGLADMQRTVDALSALAPENITIHTLAIKRASKLNEHRIEHSLTDYAIPDGQTIKEQLQIAHDGCTGQGLIPYYLYRQKNMAALFENTGYSLPGHECLYNVGMMSEVQTVYGIGAGAVSKFLVGNLINRKINVRNPELYIERMQSLKERR